jgi:hypothetical protein
MAKRPDLDDGELAAVLSFDEWIKELADRFPRLGPTLLRSDALSLVRGRARGAATTELDTTIARLRDAYNQGRLTSLERDW